MLDCLILGDSIANGVHAFKNECALHAKNGVNSRQYYQTFVLKQQEDFSAEVVLISLGSNDYQGIRTYDELYRLRERVNAKRVYWVLPKAETFPDQEYYVQLMAISFGDFVIKPTKYQKDNVHPTWNSYKEIAEQAK